MVTELTSRIMNRKKKIDMIKLLLDHRLQLKNSRNLSHNKSSKFKLRRFQLSKKKDHPQFNNNQIQKLSQIFHLKERNKLLLKIIRLILLKTIKLLRVKLIRNNRV